jgi:hexosaminidase
LKNHHSHCLFLFGFVCSLVLVQGSVARCQETPLPLMPLPAHMVMGEGQFAVDGSLGVEIQGYSDGRLVSGKKRFLNILYRETGIPVEGAFEPRQANFVIKTAGAGALVQNLGENESYRLEVSKTGVLLTAPNPLGVLHGLQTFLQLVRLTPQGFVAPAVTIDDEPRFPWRGLMIDSGRHFMPVPVITRNLDGMEAVKMNVFHWHLSDDQGFPVESKLFPLLQGKGSNGQFYTQKQIGEVVQYARERGIRVVPEFDMPCHTTSWLVGYPQLASGKGPYAIADRWGVMDPAIDPTREGTYQFLDRFIGEMAGLFPDAYFHIGGDECDGKEWDANPRIKAFMRAHGMKDNAALQSYFTARVQKLVAGHHKIMEGWDEVLQPDTPRDVVIQSWRGEKALAVAVRQGNRVVLSNGYYIDLNQPAAEHYLVDPLAGDGGTLTPEQKARVLGGEATMWSEYVTGENIDSRIWPRTAAIAERLWSPENVRDVDSMYERLAVVSQELQNYGLEHESSPRFMLERIGGGEVPEPLQVLAAVVQPPRGYMRGGMREYHTFTPLNRLTDAVPPESETARKFNALVLIIVAGKATPKQWQEARDWLVLWRNNDAKLQPLLGASDLAAELVPVSRDLSATAAIGLKALDDLEHHRASNMDKSMEALEAAAKPQAVLLDMVVPSVQLLVKAASVQR